jgi:hypothetical protein
VWRVGPLVCALAILSCAAPPAPQTVDPHRDHPAAAIRASDEPPPATPLPRTVPSVSSQPTQGPEPSLPIGDRLSSAQADFDCDGRADQLEFFERLGAVPAGSNTLARLTLASGRASELALTGDEGFAPLIGVTDVNGDGCADAIVTVGHGASTVWTGFLVYDGSLRRVEEDGAPAMFLFSGSVRHGNSIECRRTKDTTELVARGVSDYTSDFEWDLVEDVHHWSGRTRLVPWSTIRSVIAVSVRYAAPPDHERYWGLSCGDVKTG